MARYIPNEFVEEYHGKLCSHSAISFAKKGKTKYTMKRCNPRNLTKNPYTQNELRVHSLFKTTRTAIKNLTLAEKTAYQTAWAAYSGDRYSTLNGYIFAQEYAKAKAAAEA